MAPNATSHRHSGMLSVVVAFVATLSFSWPALGPCLAAVESGAMIHHEPVRAKPRPAKRNKAKIKERFEAAQTLHKIGRTDAALYELQQLIIEDPENTDALFQVAEMAIASKNWAEAILVLGKVGTLRPKDIPTRLVLMDIYKAYQMPVQEIMAGREVLALDPKNVQVLRRLAAIYHEEDMPESEIKMREALMVVDPNDRENMEALAHLDWKIGEVWDEIVVQREIKKQQPKKPQTLRRLAVLYGDEKVKDYFNELETIREIPGHHKDPVVNKWYHKADKAFRKELKIYDPLRWESYCSWEKANEFDMDRRVVEASYMHSLTSRFQEHGVWAQYGHTDYTGTNELIGTAKIDSYAWQLRHSTHTERGRNSLNLGLGTSTIAFSGGLRARYDPELTPAEYPFLEARSYGGTEVTGVAEFTRKLTNRVGLTLSLTRDIMSDIDAQVRTMTYVGGLAEVDYELSDQTRIAIQEEVWKISDGNTFSNPRLVVERYLLGSESVHDYRGHRASFFSNSSLSFLKRSPSSFLKLRYQGDFKNHSRASSFYEIYQDEVEHEVALTSEILLRPKAFLKIEGLCAEGNHVLISREGYVLGIGYRDRDTENEVLLEYSHLRDSTNEWSQTNLTIGGISVNDQIQLSGLWHF